jgi:hypothetical protein
MFSLRICMPHSIDEGAVRFLRPDGEDYENALAVFERECVRIVAEECASRDAEVARLRAVLEKIVAVPRNDIDGSWKLDVEQMVWLARKALEGKS